MKNSLLEIKAKFNELNEKLKNDSVMADIKLYTKISKELNSVKKVVEVFDEYLINEKNILESKEALTIETDPDFLSMIKHEINESEKRLPILADELKLLLLPVDENDDKNVIIEIRGAAGGDEANIFAGDLFKIYSKYSDINNWKVRVMDAIQGTSGGFTQIVFSVSGEKVYSKLKFESGVHRVQRVPQTETQGRIHTSTSTVIVMPEIDDDIEIEINNSDLRVDTYRSSGSGGQSVNTTDSAVRITHIPTGTVASCQEGKSQIANKDIAMKMLKSKLYDLELQKKNEQVGSFRKLAGSGARSEKIRTYNYPQDRVTDHRISYTTSLKYIVDGKLNSIIDALLAEEQAEKIKSSGF